MDDFPENEVETLDDYVSDNFIERVRAGLNAGILAFKGEVSEPADGSIEGLVVSRTELKFFLISTVFKEVRRNLKIINEQISRGNFKGAETTLKKLANLPRAPNATDLRSTLRSTAVEFTELVQGAVGKPFIPVDRTLPGYAGPKPSDAPQERLIALGSFLSKGPERRFRVDLLGAEINVGLRKFDKAINLYDGLLAVTPSAPRHKFLAIRSAFARVSRGDQLFRKQRVLTDRDRRKITGLYDAAVQLLQANDVSPDNPRRREIEAHVSQQKARLQSRLNFLGLWDAFVPVQRLSVLQEAAAEQIEDAIASVERFIDFLARGEHEIEKEMDVAFQKQEEQLNLLKLGTQRTIATLGVTKIEQQLSAINSQQDSLFGDAVIGGLRSIVEGALKGGPAGVAISVAGIAGSAVNFFDQSEQLAQQRRMTEIEKGIAQNQVEIARLELQISKNRIEFYKQKLDFLATRRLNADLLLVLAQLNEKRAQAQLEGAIFLAYLFERALAFFLGEPDIRHIQFNYLDGPVGIFDAAKALKDDFRRVQQEFTKVSEEKIDDFLETVSLRETYPIQFSRFLQTGEMGFVYSLYQLSKRRPASHQCRLRDAGVEIVGLLPTTGFSGTLTHFGRFMVRDKIATLDPTTTRLTPTEEQLAQALEDQRRLGLPVAAVGGVLYYNLEPDTRELSQNTPFVSPAPSEQFTLDLFERRGPTGLWKLEIKEHGKLAISDILFHYAIVSRESDPFVLGPRVEELVRSYELELAAGDFLDRVSPFSLRQNFPNTFFQLQTGPAALDLTKDNFQKGLTNLQFKMVIAQALDQEGKGISGVALEISRPEIPFNQARVTGNDGFTENLDGPPETLPRDQRFPTLGTWQIRLPDQAQFSQLSDLRLFFMYSFEEL